MRGPPSVNSSPRGAKRRVEGISNEQVRAHIEAVLRPPKWYPLDVIRSDSRLRIIGYEYTDAEGAPRTKQYADY